MHKLEASFEKCSIVLAVETLMIILFFAYVVFFFSANLRPANTDKYGIWWMCKRSFYQGGLGSRATDLISAGLSGTLCVEVHCIPKNYLFFTDIVGLDFKFLFPWSLLLCIFCVLLSCKQFSTNYKIIFSDKAFIFVNTLNKSVLFMLCENYLCDLNVYPRGRASSCCHVSQHVT